MLGPFATASRFTLSFTSGRYCRTPLAHRCPRQRQRVTEGTAMAPWNGPNQMQVNSSQGPKSKGTKTQLCTLERSMSMVPIDLWRVISC